ncbi:MAG TPA: glycosyltransferase [Rhizomicrobium sp.]|jgi:predicted LPLAT superfamily acyltransferase|nr:glycosyltransferase [Rhizomicrobium sp.]
MSTCAVLPTHNHVDALDAILTRLETEGLQAIVIDDGSTPDIAARIRETCARHPNAEYLLRPTNGGKGAAVLSGLTRASERGFSHAVQIDADGQHDLDGLAALLAMSARYPNAVVSGVPQYDKTLPLMRRIWRPFTNFWVHVNTLSFQIVDAMCGFRVYPAAAILALPVKGRRMDFDIEVLVKAYWAGIAVAAAPVQVRYPQGNFSNFDVLRDNVRLSALQTRLFFGMLLRSPVLLFRRPRLAEPQRWSSMGERGAYWGLRILASVYRVLGRTICVGAMAPAVLYFFITGREQRQASRDYLDHLWRSGRLAARPTLWMSFSHFLHFGASLVDKLAGWTGDIPHSRLNGASSALMQETETSGRGAFVITAHLGNPEVMRAVVMLGQHMRVNVLMHTAHSAHFNKLIQAFSPDAPVRAIPVTKVGADTAILLAQAIANGEWVVIMGDRVGVEEDSRVIEVPFLGELAQFPQGPYILGAILKAPSYLLFCLRGKKGFDVHFSKFADPIVLPRADRIGAIRSYATQFAQALEARVAEAPLQWFNFYAFWRPRPAADTAITRRAAE